MVVAINLHHGSYGLYEASKLLIDELLHATHLDTSQQRPPRDSELPNVAAKTTSTAFKQDGVLGLKGS